MLLLRKMSWNHRLKIRFSQKGDDDLCFTENIFNFRCAEDLIRYDVLYICSIALYYVLCCFVRFDIILLSDEFPFEFLISVRSFDKHAFYHHTVTKIDRNMFEYVSERIFKVRKASSCPNVGFFFRCYCWVDVIGSCSVHFLVHE